jgi:glycosyltransferase involved in cell wall biosynthesis
MKKTITFITTGDIAKIATMKRALGMANPLVESGWDVSIIALDCIENRKRIAFECGPSVQVFYYTDGDMAAEVNQKTALIGKIAPGYIYFCSFSARNRIDKRKAGFKGKVIIEHSELPSAIKGKRILRKLLDFIVERYSVIYADMLVGASKYLVSYYKKWSSLLLKSRMPVDYSPYAYNEDVVNAKPVILEELRNRYDGKKVFLYMGTMTRNYGLFTMLKAAEQLKDKQGRGFMLLLLGGGPDLQEAKQYVEKQGLTDVVGFTGYTPEEELSSYFRLTNAFISPINNTVQDIARCPSKIYMFLPFQKPVFTCRLGEPYEIFGEQGFYFDNDQPGSLTQLMENVLQDDMIMSSVDMHQHSWKKRVADFNSWIQSTKADK